MSNNEEDVDTRFTWMSRQVQNSFKNIKMDKFVKFMQSESCMRQVYEFLDVAEVRLICFCESSGNVSVTIQHSTKFDRGNWIYLLKLEQGPIDPELIENQVMVGDMSSNPLKMLSRIVHGVYAPLLGNPANQEEWSEIVSKDVMDGLQGFLATLQITEGQVAAALALKRIVANTVTCTFRSTDKHACHYRLTRTFPAIQHSLLVYHRKTEFMSWKAALSHGRNKLKMFSNRIPIHCVKGRNCILDR